MLIERLVWNLTCFVVDMKTAFFHGDLHEEICMEVPKGLAIKDKKKLILQKTIYGIVQRAWKFYEKLINFLGVCGQCGMKK
jgi:hypothetical protein